MKSIYTLWRKIKLFYGKISERVFYLGRNHKFSYVFVFLSRLIILVSHIQNLLLHGYIAPRIFVVSDEKKVIYLSISKAANTSIKATFADIADMRDNYDIHYKNIVQAQKELTKKQKEYFKFTFVRNPFSRLVSSYVNKYKNGLGKRGYISYDYYLLGYLKADKGFDNYVKKIIKLPDFLANDHFKSQYCCVYKRGKKLVDYVGKFESINNDFPDIQKKFSLNALPHFNKTLNLNWMDYYSFETAGLVYRKYHKDIKEFGYEDEYRKLVEYLKAKSPSQ